jgi:hypothetical protein
MERVREHMALPRQQGQRADDGHRRNDDALARLLAASARDQLLHRVNRQHHGGNADQHHLKQGGERLGLAVAEAVVVVRRLARHPDARQRRHRGDQIERRIGQAAQHRRRAGRPCAIALDRHQQAGHGDRGQRGAAVQRGVVMGAAHG